MIGRKQEQEELLPHDIKMWTGTLGSAFSILTTLESTQAKLCRGTSCCMSLTRIAS